MITIEQLRTIIPGAGPRAAIFLDPINAGMEEFGINTPLRVAWRSAVWAYCWSVDAAVAAKTRAAPAPGEVISELPLLVLP